MPARLLAAILIFAVLRPALALDLTLDESRVLRLAADASAVVVGNPSVADVAVHNGRTLIVTAKSFGQTNLIVLDNHGAETAAFPLRVTAQNTGVVSVFEGRRRQTLLCLPQCQTVVQPGDGAAEVRGATDAAAQKIDLARRAAKTSD